ncbi:glycoside hydrolase family 65 protein [Enterococcus sp. DIV0876]|uniref:glycoside hydrolase family 65 protein n=1 Tax=Enterococcus sp. DIV0876 TaxID=2774633 RepID=UPI003D2FE472
MAKIADSYYMIDPWQVSEIDFDPARSEVSESIFALANEYMGVRGYFEEGYSGNQLLGSYFNGIYENSPKENHVKYKGIVSRSHFMVNAVDWLYTRIRYGDQQLDLATATIENFERHLDLRSGLLIRSFDWLPNPETRINIVFERILDMQQVSSGYQRICFKSETAVQPLQVLMGIDFNTIHTSEGQNFWEEISKQAEAMDIQMVAQTITTNQKILSRCSLRSTASLDTQVVERDKFIGFKFNVKLNDNIPVVIERQAVNIADKTGEEISAMRETDLGAQVSRSFEDMLHENTCYWQNVWQKEDIEIDGDESNQQGIRFCIFQLHQTYHGQDPTHNIGAKGLTGESYGGHAFWDTETSCLPFYLLTNLAAAKNLLEFRYNTLPEAKKRAIQLDCRGACYPIATLNGHEASDLWQHASLQFQPSTGVAYGIWHYVNVSEDLDFLYGHGIEMLIEISRFLVSRGDWSPVGDFGFYGVMGPDEFQMMVNHNMYTNYMAKRTINYTLEALAQCEQDCKDRYQALIEKFRISVEERNQWKTCAEKMLFLQEPSGLIEQHDGFFKLPHIDIHSIPIADFPLYDHWSYDRIYRNDMIKQPDVLMFLFLYNQSFTKEEKQINYDYYEPKTIHESSLSPSIHSILAAELGKNEEAYAFFEFATRMDLDNFNRNTREGLHTTSIAAAWMNIVYGFGGVRTDENILILAPIIPKKWKRYMFNITYKQRLIQLTVTQNSVNISLVEGEPLPIKLYQKQIQLGDESVIAHLK